MTKVREEVKARVSAVFLESKSLLVRSISDKVDGQAAWGIRWSSARRLGRIGNHDKVPGFGLPTGLYIDVAGVFSRDMHNLCCSHEACSVGDGARVLVLVMAQASQSYSKLLVGEPPV